LALTRICRRQTGNSSFQSDYLYPGNKHVTFI
jgi:hypothetical protein